MNKGTIVCGIAAALIGSGLLWASNSGTDSGIAGWETLNVSMEQAIGAPDREGDAAQKQEDQGKAGRVNAETESKSKAEIVAGTEIVQAEGNGQKAAPTADGDDAGAGAAADQPVPVPTASAVSQEGLINVNTAASAELMNLPGVGEKKAQAIIDYRSSNGPFRSLSDLGKVKGIGPKMLEKLKPLVVF